MTVALISTREEREGADFARQKSRFLKDIATEGITNQRIMDLTTNYLGYCRTRVATSEFESLRLKFVKDIAELMKLRDVIVLLPEEVTMATMEAYGRMLEDPCDEVRQTAIMGLMEPSLFVHTAETTITRIESGVISDSDIDLLLGVLEFFGKNLKATPEEVRAGQQTRLLEEYADNVGLAIYVKTDESKDALLRTAVNVMGMFGSPPVNEHLVDFTRKFIETVKESERKGETVVINTNRNFEDQLRLARMRKLYDIIEPLLELIAIGRDEDNKIFVTPPVTVDIVRTLMELGVPMDAFARQHYVGIMELTGLVTPPIREFN